MRKTSDSSGLSGTISANAKGDDYHYPESVTPI
jgi:hypothetical protein